MSAKSAEPIVLGPITVTFSVEADDSNGSVTVSRCDVKHGSGMPVAHSHDAFEETLYGLDGVTTLIIDGTPIELGPGETVCIPRGAVHTFIAEQGDVAFLAIATPGVFGPEYFHELAGILQAAGDGPPDPAAIGAVMLRHGLTPAPQPRA
jgi:quercetin dioxygenase-like cupin family protein